ncbi:MAG: FmdB family zinc ribbon protein [Acidimicrobiaceae bacterium]|jgi:predicted nucleic acid-binding Zn ribbon protein
MPTYVYKFVETGETIEVQQDFSEDTLTEAVHPVDGTMRPVKKVFLPVGITFKGGGFYKTDSGKSGASTASSSSSSSGESSSASSSSDSSSSASTPSSSSSTD